MNELNCKNVKELLKSDFGALWKCQPTGGSLEITTPFLYPDNSFVTLFITKRGRNLVVSDGAQSSEFFQCAKDDEPFFASIIAQGKAANNVGEHVSGDRRFYFKQTQDLKLIPSIAFDVANFLVATTNAASLGTAEEDSTDKNSFRVKADRFIGPLIKRGRTVKFSQKLPEVKEASFSAVVKSDSQLWLVLYLTGSNSKYFQLSTSNAIVNVEFLHASSIFSRVKAVIPFLNDDAMGYQPNQLAQRIQKLTALTKIAPIHWKRKDEIIAKLAA